MKTYLFAVCVVLIFPACDTRINVPPAEKNTTIVNPPAEKKESNTTIVNSPAEKKTETNTTTTGGGGTTTTTTETKR